jgi:hypothetical protein
MAVTPDWTRTVTVGASRRQAILAALAELPAGPVWDLTIGHDPNCPCLTWGAIAELVDCTCQTLTIKARQLR